MLDGGARFEERRQGADGVGQRGSKRAVTISTEDVDVGAHGVERGQIQLAVFVEVAGDDLEPSRARRKRAESIERTRPGRQPQAHLAVTSDHEVWPAVAV